NGVHFACVICCETLHFPAFWKISAGLILVASQSSATTCIHISLDSRGQRSGKYSVNPSPALAFSRSDGYSRPSWTTDQPPCSVSRPCGSQSRNWHPSPLVR